MLIGLGEPFMDRKIFDRIEYCERHGISTLLSTNGDVSRRENRREAARFAASSTSPSASTAPSKETFEHYRKGARFEKVRDNFVRFANMKHQRRSKMQIVVQMVRMPGNAHEVGRLPPLLERRRRRRPGSRQRRRNQSVCSPKPRPTSSGPVTISGAARCTSSTMAASFPAARATCSTASPSATCANNRSTEIFNSDEMRRLRRLARRRAAAAKSTCAPDAAPSFRIPCWSPEA